VRRFGAPWDRPLVVSTLAALAGLLVVAVAGCGGALRAGLRGTALAVALVSAGVAVGGWALAPRAFEIGAGKLRVLRNGWRALELPLAEITSVAHAEPGLLAGSIRLLGTGGLFGYYGLFRSPTLGAFRLYATRSEGLVLVRSARRALVLTPEPADVFVTALLAAAPGAERERLATGGRRP
jgi:hypothetical protein